MTDKQHAFFEKARRALATAQINLNHGDVEAAISRAYYAAFYAAMAALLSVGEAPKTHSGTLQRFRLHFIKTVDCRCRWAMCLPTLSTLDNEPITRRLLSSTKSPPPTLSAMSRLSLALWRRCLDDEAAA